MGFFIYNHLGNTGLWDSNLKKISLIFFDPIRNDFSIGCAVGCRCAFQPNRGEGLDVKPLKSRIIGMWSNSTKPTVKPLGYGAKHRM